MSLRDVIHAFDPSVPIERASTPPSSWYTTHEVARLERAAVWTRTWQYACRVDEVATPGSWVAVEVDGQPWVVVRDEEGVLRALHNVCRHKAALVCRGRGSGDALVCPYHGWAYRLDGSLKRAPKLGGIQDFDRAAMSLPALQVEVWGPWVFVNADLDAPPLHPQLGPLTDVLERSGWRDLRYVATKHWEVPCNWKAFCDNYLDGGYHIPHMHPSLDAQLDMPGYRTTLYERFNVQTAPPTLQDGEALAFDPRRRIGEGAIYAWIYPNFMINRYGPVLDINVVRPRPGDPHHCDVTFAWWFDPSCDEAFIERSLAQTDVTQEEDIEISALVQQGLRSESYTVGRYAPRLETGIHHFHQLLSADLRGALDYSG